MQTVVLFGASKVGENAYNNLQNSYKIIYFCDNDPNKWGKKFCGIQVLSPSDLEKIDDLYVIITSMYTYEIAQQLISKGITSFGIYRHAIYESEQVETYEIEHFDFSQDIKIDDINKNICLITTSNSGSNILALFKMIPKSIADKYNISLCHAAEMKNDFFMGYDFMREVISNKMILFDVRSPRYKMEHNVFFQLWHGFPLKGLGFTSKLSAESSEKSHNHFRLYDLIASYSPFYNTILSACMGIPTCKFRITGMPRNDFLFKSNGRENLFEITEKNITGKRIIYFMPTYRNSPWLNEKSGAKKWSNIFGMENFNSEKFDSYLEENNLLVVFKTHPLEETEVQAYIKEFELKNIILLTNKMLVDNNLDLYETLNAADLLITDYSSVYFDFLLLNRPMVFVPIDLVEYGETRGFTLEPYEMWTPGPKVIKQEHLEREILKSLDSRDYYENERSRMLDLCHTYKDGNASNRVWEIILEYMR